nr:E-beta-farnesene synthase [Tanacetum cinerariifolium]
MADVNVNAPADQAPTMAPPTRTDDQILPHIRWRAFIAIINLYLTGKTSGLKRPRALVLQILWGVVNRAHIDYAERIWEEFTQSIHNFIEDKKNLTQHTQGKIKATLIVILSIRFTKLIIYYLQSKYQFHPRPDSPLHLPNEEPVLRYLKFSAKGTKREVFGMPIPNDLITADIQGEQYYKEYLEKVAKHQRYIVSEEGSDPDSPAPKPAKATKKSKPSAPKADLRPPPTSSLRSVDESVDEGTPEKEPRFDDEEADLQRAVEESLKSVHDVPRGPLPSVVIKEPDSGKFQLLPETPKKVSPAKQYIFQRRTPTSTEPSGHDESSLIYAALGLTDSASKSNEEVPLMENLKLTVEEYVILEDASSIGTLSSLQHLAKDFSFGDLFFNDKPSEAYNEKTTTETEAESMVLDSPNVHWPLQATATETTTTTTTTTHPPPPQPQQSTIDSMLIKHIGELEQIMANLIQHNKYLEERLDSHGARLYTLENLNMKEILHQRIWETNSYKAHKDHMMLYEALEKSMNRDHTEELLEDLAEARKKKKKRRDSPKTPPGSPPHQPPPPSPSAGSSGTSRSPRASGSSQVPPPPPPPPSTNQEGQSHGSTSPSSSKTVASAEYIASTTTDTRLRPSVSSIHEYLHIDNDMAPDA